MEFEDVSKKVEWEARRVATAFDIETFGPVLLFIPRPSDESNYRGNSGDITVSWRVDKRTLALSFINLACWSGYESEEVTLHYHPSILTIPGGWEMEWEEIPSTLHSHFRAMLARHLAHSLYRLGFEDQGVLRELNHPLSAHEKLELRLSMPREFWPQRWLDEEKGQSEIP